MKKRKYVAALIISLCFAFTSVGFVTYTVSASADSSSRELYEQIAEEYDGNGYNEFLLGSWITFYDYDVTPFEQQMKAVTDSGINFSFAPHANITGNYAFDSLDDWLEIDALCSKYGLYYVMNPAFWGDGANTVAFENGISWAEEMSDYMLGYHLKDEPSRATFASLAAWYGKYVQADPARYPYVNLYPSYVGAAGLGGTYREYLQAWIDAVGAENMMALSHDFYPFGTSSTNTGIFSDLEDMRAVAYENGKLPTHGFIQSTGWRNMRMPNIDEIRWNMYSYLAYGFKALSYFNYCNPSENGEGFDVSLIMPDGTVPNPVLYDKVSDLNWDVRLLGTQLINLDTVHAYHTTSRYAGTEILPENFFIHPDSDCDFVVSLMENKHDGGWSVMLFNNSYTSGVTQRFVLDSFSGVNGLERFNLKTGKWEDVSLSSGMFTLSFEAGEGILLRVNGNLILDAEVRSPEFSVASGTYSGPVTLGITAGEGEEIYYTLDGSYPTENSYRYTEPFKVGKDFGNSGVTVRAVSVRGNTVSAVSEADYVILDASRNIALGAPVTLTADGVPYGTSREFGAEVITDGSDSNGFTFGTKAGKYAWAVVDLGSVYAIDSLRLNLYDNAEAKSVIVQASNDYAFRTGVTSLFNADRENLSGYGGESATDVFDASGEIAVGGSVSARYVRVYCRVNNRSLFTEIEVYQRPEGAENIEMLEGNFIASGAWSYKSDSAVHAQSGALSDGLVIKDFYARNAVLSANFSYGACKLGFVGFELFKADSAALGVRVGVTPTGQVRWQIGNRNGYGYAAADFNPSSFDLKIAAAGSSIAVIVNGENIQSIAVENVSAGYAAVYCGNNDVTVKNVSASEITDVSGEKQHTVTVVSSVLPVTVDINTVFADVVKILPKTVQCLDDAGNELTASVAWDCPEYRFNQSGVYFVYGTLSGVTNVRALRAQAAVTVRTKISYALLDRAIALADKLNPSDYTADSWARVAVYYDNAVSVRVDSSLPQNAINVAGNQLESAISSLVYADSEQYKATLTAMRDTAAAVNPELYTRRSYGVLTAVLERVNGVLDSGTATREQVNECEVLLKAALSALSEKGDTEALNALIAEAESLNIASANAVAAARLKASLKTAKIYALLSDPDSEIIACVYADLQAKIAAVKSL